LATLDWVVDAIISESQIGIAYEINQSVHLLANGLLLGGVVPLAALVLSTVFRSRLGGK